MADFFEGLLAHAHFAAIVLGIVFSTGFTQLMKYPVRLYFYRKGLDPQSRLTPAIEVEFHTWVVRAIAVVSGAIVIFVIWPDGRTEYRAVWALAGGVASPTIYSVVVHFWPWLGDKASADKAVEPDDGNQ